MKQKIVIGLLSIGILTTGLVSVSALVGPKSKAEMLSELTGKSVEKIEEERANAKTYGQVASENDVLEEFQEKVSNGVLTQEQADQMLSHMEQNQANCDGYGSGMNHGMGAYHKNAGSHHGMGHHNGFHRGR